MYIEKEGEEAKKNVKSRHRLSIMLKEKKKEKKKIKEMPVYSVELFHRYIYYRHHNIITYYTMFLLCSICTVLFISSLLLTSSFKGP